MLELLDDYYANYDEDSRLLKDNAHQVEFITTKYYFNKLFPKGACVLDTCAGTGIYSFHLAEQGFQVTAGDVVPFNTAIIEKKQRLNPVLNEIYTGSATDLSRFSKSSFDVVLCMGALYHTRDKSDMHKVISECLRVLKVGGLMAVAYINNNAAALANLGGTLENMDEALASYHEKAGEPFVYTTPSRMEKLLSCYDVEFVSHVGADGIAYLVGDKINAANKDNFYKWIELHLLTCEDNSILGYSLHGLIFVRKLKNKN